MSANSAADDFSGWKNPFEQQAASDEFSGWKNPFESNPAGEGRGITGVTTDSLKSIAVGSNALLELAGNLYGLTTGDMENWASDQGARGREYWNSRKSPQLKQMEAERKAKVDAAEGEWAKMGTAFWSTFSSPSLLASYTFEQLPNLLITGGAGRAAGTAAKAIMGKTGREVSEKTVSNIATGGAVVTGGAMQGSDVGGNAYDQLMALPDEIWLQNPALQARIDGNLDLLPRAKREIAAELSRNSAVAATALSIGINSLPIFRILEERLAGATGKMPQSRILEAGKGFVGESVGEGLEEGSGAALANVAVNRIDPNQSITTGVGEAAGMGLAAGPIGLIAGAMKPKDMGAADIARTIFEAPDIDSAIDAAGRALDGFEMPGVDFVPPDAPRPAPPGYESIPGSGMPTVEFDDTGLPYFVGPEQQPGAQIPGVDFSTRRDDETEAAYRQRMADEQARVEREFNLARDQKADQDIANANSDMQARLRANLEAERDGPANPAIANALLGAYMRESAPVASQAQPRGQQERQRAVMAVVEQISDASTTTIAMPSGNPFPSEKIAKSSMSFRNNPGARIVPAPAGKGVLIEVRQKQQGESEWVNFKQDTGTLGIPRDQMPQIKAEHRGAMVNFLKGRFIQSESDTVPAASLKPTQVEFSPAKVKQALEYEGGNRSILVSSDGYIVDGHHQWLASIDGDVNVIRIDAPIDEILQIIKQFPSATTGEATPATGHSSRIMDFAKKAKSLKEVRDFVASEFGPRGAQALDAAAVAAWNVRNQAQRRKIGENDSLATAVAKLGGISLEWRQDITGDDKANKMIPGVGQVFSKNGTSPDDMALRLYEEGYITRAEYEEMDGRDTLYNALSEELAGGAKKYKLDSLKALEQQLQDQEDQFSDEARELYNQREQMYWEIEQNHGAEAAQLARLYDNAAQEVVDQLIEDAAIYEEQIQEIENVRQASAEADLFPEDQAAGDERARQAAGQANRQPAETGRGEATDRAGREAVDFDLASPTEEGLAAQARKQAADAATARQKDLEAQQRQQADTEAKDFRLTGSNLPSDVAAAGGQSDMFVTTRGSPQRQEEGLGAGPRITPDIAANLKSGDIIVDDKGQEFVALGARHKWLEAAPIIDGKANVSADTTFKFHLEDQGRDLYKGRNFDPVYTTGRNLYEDQQSISREFTEDEVLAWSRAEIKRLAPREAARYQSMMKTALEKYRAEEIIKAERDKIPVPERTAEKPSAPQTETDKFISEFLGEKPSGEPDIPSPTGETKSTPAAASSEAVVVSEQEKIEDFGEKLGGARKDKARMASMALDLTAEDIANKPLSEIWPKAEVDAIEDKDLAAFAHGIRSEIPTKPRRPYAVKSWAEKIATVRGLVQEHAENGEKVEQLMRNGSDLLKGFIAKVDILRAIDREQWNRIGSVAFWPNAYRYDEGGNKVASPSLSIVIDDRRESFSVSTIADAIDSINEKLGNTTSQSSMKFELRGFRKDNDWFIVKKGDSEYRRLKSFSGDTALEDARKFLRENQADLESSWEAIKERDNINKADVRNEENRPRTGKDYRLGKDVTPEQFTKEFGFRGVEFGNWVAQGKNAKERQGMLNQAYDALMDLAEIAGIPPMAISLNGSMGLAFGSRGSGSASAHFESDNLVINLTKTRGAGTLAHEWFHALDNYFQRERGAIGVAREDRFVTYRPEPLYVHKSARVAPMTKAKLDRYHKERPNSGLYNPDNWMPDPQHPEGVRPVVERAFAELVETLDASPMRERASAIDKGKTDGYWSRIIERAARAFENYVITKMHNNGYDNDYLANVKAWEEWGGKNPGKYPYLKPDEIAPVAQAFDNLFATLESKRTETGIALFSRSEKSEADSYRQDLRKAMASLRTNAGKLRYQHTEKSLDFSMTSGVQFPGVRGQNQGSGIKVLTELDIVNKPAGFSRPSNFRRPISLPLSRASALMSAITGRLKNAPEVIVVQSMQDASIPEAVRREDAKQRSQGATGEPEGFYYQGKAYIVLDGLTKRKGESDAQAIYRVFAHEVLGHAGLRGLFRGDLNAVLNEVSMKRRPDVIRKAKEYGLDIAKQEDRLTAAEEVLAEMAQTESSNSLVTKAIEAIRRALRRLFMALPTQARKELGGSAFAEWVNGMSDAEIIDRFIVPARQFIRTGAASSSASTAPAFQRASTALPQELQALERDANELSARVSAAYESGNLDLAEELDARLEGIYDQLESALEEMQEDGVDVESDGFKTGSLFDETDREDDLEGSLARDYFYLFVDETHYRVDDDIESKVATLRDNFSYSRDAQAAAGQATDEQIIEAARDAYERKTKLFERRKSGSAIGNSDALGSDNPVIRFSRSRSSSLSQETIEFVDGVLSGEISASNIIDLDGTPLVYQALGASDLPLRLPGSVVKKAVDGKHSLTADQLMEALSQIHDPVMVFDSATESGALVALTSVFDSKGRPVVVAIHLEKRDGRYEVNSLASIHGRSSAGHVKNWIEDGLLAYRHKRKSRSWLQSVTLQLRWEGVKNGSRGRVLLDTDVVNRDQVRFSRTSVIEQLLPIKEESEYVAEMKRLRDEDRTLWDKAKALLRKNFAPGGLLPDSVFREKIARDGKLNVVELTIQGLVKELEAAIRADYDAQAKNLAEPDLKALSGALAGKMPRNMKERTKTAILAMRQYIDHLSQQYANILKQQMEAMTANLDEGELALLEGFIEAGKVFAEENTPAAKAAATRQRNAIMEQARERAKEIWGDGKKMMGALSKVAQIAERASLMQIILNNVGQYVHRSYQVFDDPSWNKKIPQDVMDNAMNYLMERYMEDGQTSEDEARLLAEKAIDRIIKTDTAYADMESFIKESKLGAKDLSVLKKRQDIAPEIRALMGEYVDPRINFAKTATKMGWLIFNQKFLEKVRQQGMGVFLFEKEDAPVGTEQIAAQDSEVYAPLNGLYAPREVIQAFKDALGREQMSDWYRVIVQINGMIKGGKTVLSPTTSARNFMSAMFFAIANGHFDLTQARKALALINKFDDKQKLEYVKKLVDLGVLYDNPYANEMMDLLRESGADRFFDESTVLGKAIGSTAEGARRTWEIAREIYSFGDDFWKVIGFENERAKLLKYTGMSEAVAEREAAERIRNLYPTYSMVGSAVQWLRRFPLVGTFVSFPAEIIRTSFNLAKTVRKDWKSPRMRRIAIDRAIGMSFAAGFAYAAQEITKAMFDIDDDDEEAIRLQAAPWQRNSNIVVTGRDEEGNLRYIDISFLDPYNYFKRPITAIMRDQPIEDALLSGARDMLAPFLGTDIAAGALMEIYANQKETGGQIYKDADDVINQVADIADHLRKAIQPGIATSLERTWLALQEERTPSGKKYDLVDEGLSWIGWRVSTLDPKTALYYRTFDFGDAKADASRVLRETLNSPNAVSRDDIANAIERSEKIRTQAYDQMITIVGASRRSGMNSSAIMRVLRASNVSQRDVAALLRGEVPEYQPSGQSEADAVKRAEAIIGKEAAMQIRDRYRQARREMK